MNRCTSPRGCLVRRLAAPVVVATMAVALTLGGSPPPVAASCATLMPLEAAAALPDAAVFTGRAVREDAEHRVVFVVDRWFTGSHPARVVLFRDELAGLVEEPEAGVIPAVLAATVSGEGSGFNRDEPVIVAAVRTPSGEYDPVICAEAVVALVTPEGRARLEQATALFGPGTPASRLPATATLPGAITSTGSSAPWLPVAVFVVALVGAVLILGRRRTATVGR